MASGVRLGVDTLLADRAAIKSLSGSRVALLGHPASMTADGRHTLDALAAEAHVDLSAAFGPQHGMRGDKQDNMIESPDYRDPIHGIPVFSLYGQVRRPTDAMLAAFDTLLVDLQDVGTRAYTYVTTLFYMLEACSAQGKRVLILDRPNPVGRPIEGSILQEEWISFVGVAPFMMRHGLTLGELGKWYLDHASLDLDLTVVPMAGWDPEAGPGYGWPLGELPWINPSPNAASLNMARCFPGTMLYEGTTLSEGRGTTISLEVVGAPDLDFGRVLARMAALQPDWMKGCRLRPCYFEPTFHKHVGEMCAGVQIHTDGADYRHDLFRPYRLAILMLKGIRLEYPDYPIWRDFPYEYETDKLAIDLLTGSTFVREWVDDARQTPDDLDARLKSDEAHWADARAPYLLY